MSANDPAGGGTFARMWAELAPIGRNAETGGYRRFAWTDEDAALRAWFTAESLDRGLAVSTDRAANLWAWWGDPDAASEASDPGIVTGSHLDSVPDGGAYDGPLGIVSALAAIDELRARGVTASALTRPIGIVLFGDEEGARFGVACAGSRVLTGAMTPGRALALRDGDGVDMASAMRRAGFDPSGFGPDPEALARIGTFVELHVEQGRALVDLDRPLAVADAIWPHGRWRVDLPGRADHAGTTRLDDREDALLSAAHVVLATRAAARHHATVATIGKLAVHPGGVNAVPGLVTAWLDARGPADTAVHATVTDVATEIEALGGTIAQESWTPATPFDQPLRDRLVQVLSGADALGAGSPAAVPILKTGAGHDAGILANAGIPTGMLFVRNPTGRSHAPDEHAEEADCLLGVQALADVLLDLACRDVT